jgi:hypothetical protein
MVKNFSFAVAYKGKKTAKRMIFRACKDRDDALQRANNYEWNNPLYLLTDCREE